MKENQIFTIGIIREDKNPPDSRVILTPDQCQSIQRDFNINIEIETSGNRCFDDESYSQKGIKVVKNIGQCDILLGVKEVPVDKLIADQTYFFFSHTIKAQPYNRKLLQSVLSKKIRLVDYEVLTDSSNQRVIAFGKYAGIVGAHNALYTWGKRTNLFNLNRMIDFDFYKDAVNHYRTIDFPPVKVVVTGQGRVAIGACQVLEDMGLIRVKPHEYLNKIYDYPVFTQLGVTDYGIHSGGLIFSQEEFFQNPHLFKSGFKPFYQNSDIFINGIFWDPKAPAFFTSQEMKSEQFQIKVIADITCDIAPKSSVPSTLRPSTISDPVYGYDPMTEEEIAPYQNHSIDVMAVDNLPNELPKDASTAFGNQFIEHVLPNVLQGFDNPMIKKATIAENGRLGINFKYLSDYVTSEDDLQ